MDRSDPLPRPCRGDRQLSLSWLLVVLFSGLVLLFLPPLIRILTLVTLLAPLMAGLIALLLLALVRLVPLVFLLLGVHFMNYLRELESSA